MIIFDGGHLSEDNLSFGSQQQESIIEPTNEGLHFVFYTTSSVALGGFIDEGCWAIIPSFEREGEGILTGRDEAASEVE